jgi:hypothetical protein
VARGFGVGAFAAGFAGGCAEASSALSPLSSEVALSAEELFGGAAAAPLLELVVAFGLSDDFEVSPSAEAGGGALPDVGVLGAGLSEAPDEVAAPLAGGGVDPAAGCVVDAGGCESGVVDEVGAGVVGAGAGAPPVVVSGSLVAAAGFFSAVFSQASP